MTIEGDSREITLTEPSAMMTVADFYRGKNVLITGATGFMGKVLIEKLLRSCKDIGLIYILIRPKKGCSPIKRVDEMIKLPIFDHLRQENPSCFSKIVPIYGDVTKIDLDMNNEDRKTLEESVSIIIHAASSVRFDDPIKKAVIINVRGTRDIMELAKNMKHLKVMAYISTSYCNCITKTVEEKVIKSNYDWKTIIKLVEDTDEHILNIVQPKILDKRPNTYTFTKSLAENLVLDYSKDVPCVIIRPSIVTCTLYEPVPGWVDNLNGPVGLITATLSGVIHVIYGDPARQNDYMPCDLATNGIILAAWYKGIIGGKECEVMNSATGNKKSIYINDLMKYKDKVLEVAPPSKMLWYPFMTVTKSKFVYFMLFLFTHILPGLVADAILKMKNVNFSLMRVYRKIFSANLALGYFMTNEWKILTHKYDSMARYLSSKDLQTFNYNPDDINLIEGFKLVNLGIKRYIFKDDMSEPAMAWARKQYKIRYWLHIFTKYSFIGVLLWLAIKFVLPEVHLLT